MNAELLLQGCDGATGQVGHGRDGRDLAPTNAAMPTSSLVRVIATAAAASVRWCGLVAPTIGANTTGLAKRPDQRDRWAITSAPGGRGDTTDQLRTTTAALSAPRRLTMDNSDKWFRLDNHGHPILGSRGRRVQISPARHVRPVRGHLASSARFISAPRFTRISPDPSESRSETTRGSPERPSRSTRHRSIGGPPPCGLGQPPRQLVPGQLGASSEPACGGRCEASLAALRPRGTRPRTGPSKPRV